MLNYETVEAERTRRGRLRGNWSRIAGISNDDKIDGTERVRRICETFSEKRTEIFVPGERVAL